MNVEEFWQLISDAKASTLHLPDRCNYLIGVLSKKSVDEIVAFDCILDDRMADAYRSDVWTVAYLICGEYLSDDGFKDFRGWLIMQGREFFEKALASPLRLVDMIPRGEEPYCEEIQGVALEVYWSLTDDDSEFPHPEPYPYFWELMKLSGEPIDLANLPLEYAQLRDRLKVDPVF